MAKLVVLISFRLMGDFIRHGLKESGDGVRRGSLLHDEQSLSSVAGLSNVVEIECQPWFWLAQGAIKVRQSSKYLTRLHLMSELFNVFINRAVCFDVFVCDCT